VTDLVERFTTESLLLPHAGARVMRPRLHSVDVHWHDYYELAPIGRGSAFLLSPADFHALEVDGDEPLDCYNVVVSPAVMERELAALGSSAVDGFPWRADDLLDTEDAFRRLQAELEEPRWGSERVAESLLACLVVELARRCSPGPGPDARNPGEARELQEAVLYVDRHFREPVTLADAAARAHLSPNYFSERFRAHTGTSFQQYLQARRLHFARSLLASTTLSVTEVCHAAGFGSLSHFGRAYRRRYGTAPSRRPGTAGPRP
jgi:AraC-like DNA-binding protein